MMICPTCRRPLISLEFNSIETDYCAECRGVWLDHGELGLFLRNLPDFMPAWNTSEGEDRRKLCPHCSRKMDLLKMAGGVEADICPRRHGIWLDKGELQKIIAADAVPDDFAAMAEYCRNVFAEGART